MGFIPGARVILRSAGQGDAAPGLQQWQEEKSD